MRRTKLTILALGSRGDVQPFVALGLGLRAAGYHVTVAAAADYASLVREHGLHFHPLVGRISELADPALVEQFLGRARNPILAAHNFLRQVSPIGLALGRDSWAACRHADAIIVSTLGMYIGLPIAERANIPCIVVHLHPYTSTDAAPHMFFPRLPRRVPLRAVYNRWTHTLADHALWQVLRRPLNRVRREVLHIDGLGMLALARRVRNWQPPTLYGYSEIVAPPPPDRPATDPITGYWTVPPVADWEPDAALSRFLAAGPAPLYIGFGSIMLGRHGVAVTRMLVEAVQRTNQRALIYRGWGDMAQATLPDSVLAVDSVPHTWLFEHVAAVMHHGGAGVTAAALHAGLPAIVVPFLGDQFFWAERVHALGAGPPPLPRAHLSVERLVQAINTVVCDATLRHNAAVIGQRLKAENGVQRAVALIEAYLNE